MTETTLPTLGFYKHLWESLKSLFEIEEIRALSVLTFIVLTIGTVFYHFQEDLRWIDALYLSTMTLTTIGYGDFSPVTDGGKIFTIVYAFIGIGILVAFIETIGSHMVEHHLGFMGKRTVKGPDLQEE